LKCALGHGDALLFPCGNLRLNGKIQVYRRLGQESSRGEECGANWSEILRLSAFEINRRAIAGMYQVKPFTQLF
jgi:hypothetical protein